MIAKKVPNPKATASKSARATGLVNYITEPERENGLEKCVHYEADNFICDDLPSQISEMVALSTDNVRSKDPIDHWVFSWREDERPSIAQAREAVAMTIKHFGLEGHQFIWALHDDTKNMHVHIAVNRVHPDTLKIVKINKNFDREASQQAIALIEHAQGWKPEKGSRYQVIDGKLERRDKVAEKQLEPSRKAMDLEIQTGEKSGQRVGIEQAAPIISAAQSWAELHAEMQKAGMEYMRKGSGAIIKIGDTVLKASDIDRKASIGALQKRLGPYEPPTGIKSNEYFHHAPNTRRTATGGIEATEQNATAIRNFSKHGLRKLSECDMALDKAGRKIKNQGVLLIDGGANNRRVNRVRRDTRESEALKPDQPAWIEYQAIKAERSEAKAAELLAQRKQHDVDKDKLFAAHKAERADVLKGSWTGKGDLRNALVSVMAAQHAAQKVALREQHKEQRDALHAKYAPMPQYRAWVQQPRLLAPVTTMTPRIPQPERLSTVLMALTHSQDKRGLAFMDKGQELFIDQGRNLAVINHEQQSTRQIAAALAVAQHKFGSTLEITGPDEFKQRAIAAAVEHNLLVKFSDPKMEAQRVQMIEAKL
jgi:hypothetical protein